LTDADDDQWVVQNHDEFVDQIGDVMLRNITDEVYPHNINIKLQKVKNS